MKERLDALLVSRGLCKSREQARAFIMEGAVYVGEQRADKAGQFVPDDADVSVRGGMPFVSRGGFKLQKALDTFPIDLTGAVCADIGASTGGFTDCMLQHGAAEVFAVDVGYGQLDWKLRTDARVHVMERTNARYMEPAWYARPLTFASIDVSFISLSLILPPLFSCLAPGGQVCALIKPQFEAGRDKVGKHGVVSDKAVHAEVIDRCVQFASDGGYTVRGVTFSPIRGPKGNIEFLIWLEKSDVDSTTPCGLTFSDIQHLVDDAHIACIST